MTRRAGITALVILGGLAGAVLWAHWIAPADRVRTVTMTAVAVAVDEQVGDAVVAGSDSTGSWVRVLDTRTLATLRSVAVRGSVTMGGEFAPASVLAFDAHRQRAVVTTITAGHGVLGTGYVNVVDTRAGRLITAVPVPPRTLPVAVALDRHHGRAVVVNAVNTTVSLDRNLGSVLVFDTRRGTLIHTTLINQGPQAAAVDDQTGQSVVVGQPADPHTGSPRGPARLTLLDGASGRPVRSVMLPQMGGAISIGIEQHQLVLLSDVGDDMRAPYHSRLLQVDVQSARVARAVSVGAASGVLALDARTGRVFVTTMDEQALPPQGRVSVLDAATGTLVRTLAFRAVLGLLLVDAHAGHVFVTMTRVDRKGAGIAPGHVVMFDARSGRILHTATIGANPTAMALDARHGRLIVATTGERDESLPYWPPRGDGHVSVIDTASGRILREVLVGMDPFAVAVDERTGRAMALARGGTIRVRPSDPWSWLPSWFRRHVPLFAPAMSYRDRAVPATVSILESVP